MSLLFYDLLEKKCPTDSISTADILLDALYELKHIKHFRSVESKEWTYRFQHAATLRAARSAKERGSCEALQRGTRASCSVHFLYLLYICTIVYLLHLYKKTHYVMYKLP